MSKLNVLIVGASIAGPTAAYWLAKAGAAVTIIERFSYLRTNGQNIDIRTVGVGVMRKTPGMETAVRAKKQEMEGITFVDRNGHSFATIKPTGNPDQQSLVSEYEISRGDLGQILFDLTKDNENITYIFGEQINSMRQHENGNGPVTVEFSNGLLPTSDYDLVVACDGSFSRTRAMGFNAGVYDHIIPTNSWAAFFSLPQDLLSGSKLGHSYSAPGGRFMGIGSNKAVFMALNPSSAASSIMPFREAMKTGDDALKACVASHYSGAGWKTDDIILGMLTAEDFYANEIVQVKPPKLYNGRVVLVGDAGYAAGFTGFGTSLAMAGAYILAGEVGKHKGDVETGLRGYEETMRPIVEKLQKQPRGIKTILAPQTRWGIWIRNLIFAIVTRSGALGFGQRYLAPAFNKQEKDGLKAYEWVL